MRKELTEQAAEMARQRAHTLGEELRGAGLLPAESDDDLVPLTVVRAPGRHARSSTARSVLSRLGERLPFATSHLTVLGAIAAVALIVVAWVRISSTSEAVPAPRARTAAPVSPVAAPVSASAAAAGAASTSVVVHVAGKVRRPGVLSLPAGSRVIDAIRRAGGARAGVDLTSLNLARVLVDGEQLLVGVGTPAPASGPGPAAPGSPGPASVSLNRATLEQLEALPGVGPATAQKILDYRTAHGSFGSVDELLDVDGIGDKTLAQLTPYLTP